MAYKHNNLSNSLREDNEIYDILAQVEKRSQEEREFAELKEAIEEGKYEISVASNGHIAVSYGHGSMMELSAADVYGMYGCFSKYGINIPEFETKLVQSAYQYFDNSNESTDKYKSFSQAFDESYERMERYNSLLSQFGDTYSPTIEINQGDNGKVEVFMGRTSVILEVENNPDRLKIQLEEDVKTFINENEGKVPDSYELHSLVEMADNAISERSAQWDHLIPDDMKTSINEIYERNNENNGRDFED